jgi:hypothetical protein
MDPKEHLQTSEFIWRRLLDDTPAWVVGVPVAFALAVLLLVVFFRRERRAAGLIVALAAVGILSAVYVPLALLFRPIFSWMVVLAPMLGIALFYVGMMYFKDARSIHPLWAAFLGMLRCGVYAILSVVFLLPGCQTFDESVSYPKILVLFDVSDSMTTQDDVPDPGQDPATLPTRQDKIVKFLTASAGADKQEEPPFVERVLQNTAVDMYRFGLMLDEKEVQRLSQGGAITADQLAVWLKPNKANIKLVFPNDMTEDKKTLAKQDAEDFIDKLVSGTNIGGAANAAAKLESNSYLQAIVVVSDGNSNAGGDESLSEFLLRVNNPRRTVPVFTIGVGEYRQPISIRIEDLLAPEVVRPDDKFLIRVPVVGTGLADTEFDVALEATRVLDAAGQPLQREPFKLGPKRGKFKGAGDNPQGTVEFEIDVQALKKVKAADDKAGVLEGQWEFVARVARDPREAFARPEHISDAVKVTVQKKELRILMFCSASTREYQFVRTLLFREQQQKRVILSVYNQSTAGVEHVDQDVDKEHTLVRFPDRRGEALPGEKQYTLSEYDAIIAFDPDWSQLSKEQLKVLRDWVDKDGGGVVFVAGPVNTYQLNRPGGMDISSLRTIYPVLPKDSRLHGLKLGDGISHDSSRPYVLHFTPAAANYDFLKLDEKGVGPTAGWDAFFWAGATPEPGKNPKRGFHNYYPIEKLRPGSEVIATFGGPKSTYFNHDGKLMEQPYIVAMPIGAGKTVFLGSGETWRMRPKEGYHERFWIKLARYAAAGASLQKKYGNIYLARTAAVGTITFEAKLRDARQESLPADAHPVVLVRKLVQEGQEPKAEKTELKPRPVDDPKDWEGRFSGTVKIREEGKYEFKIPIPGTTDSIRAEVVVRKPNPEKDDVRNNFDYLYQMSSEAKLVLNTPNLSPEVRKEIQGKLKAPPSGDANESPRLFFTLQTADAISKCLRQIEPKRERVKGPLQDLWDDGFKTGLSINAYHLAWGAPLVLGVLGFAILLFLRQALYAGLFLAGTWLLALVAAISGLLTEEWPDLPIDFAFVLVSVVALLSIEWLARKLLKLA